MSTRWIRQCGSYIHTTYIRHKQPITKHSLMGLAQPWAWHCSSSSRMYMHLGCSSSALAKPGVLQSPLLCLAEADRHIDAVSAVLASILKIINDTS
jgi:hypothetical protein